MQDDLESNGESTLPNEDVGSLEYAKAIDGLRRFTQVDVSSINNINDLSAHASMISHDLRSVVLASGGIEQIDQQYHSIDESGLIEEKKVKGSTYIFSRDIKDGKIILSLGNDSVYFVVMRQEDSQTALMDLSLTLPLYGDINTQDSRMGFRQLIAADWRGGIKNYFPLMRPLSSEDNQGFAKVLKDGVSILLSALPQPAKLPETFNY